MKTDEKRTHMDLRTLEYFLMVAKEENVSHAADLLHVSQPTISRQMMQLEEEMGQTLFVRGNKNMTLTREGLFFKTRAEELLSLYKRTVNEMSDKGHEISGEISIGSGDSDSIKDGIDKGTMDIGFLFEPVNLSKYAFARVPSVEVWGILVLDRHPFAGRSPALAPDL